MNYELTGWFAQIIDKKKASVELTRALLPFDGNIQ
jgi:hypothetical protein